MDRAQFQDWFSRIDELTVAQCRKVAAVLSDHRKARPSARLRHAAGLRRARRSAGAHRFLAAVRQTPDRLAGTAEADETFVLESRKGERNLNRMPRRRGGKVRKRGLSREQVPAPGHACESRIEPFFKQIFDKQTGDLPYPTAGDQMRGLQGQIKVLEKKIGALEVPRAAPGDGSEGGGKRREEIDEIVSSEKKAQTDFKLSSSDYQAGTERVERFIEAAVGE